MLVAFCKKCREGKYDSFLYCSKCKKDLKSGDKDDILYKWCPSCIQNLDINYCSKCSEPIKLLQTIEVKKTENSGGMLYFILFVILLALAYYFISEGNIPINPGESNY